MASFFSTTLVVAGFLTVTSSTAIAMANPAAVFCEKMGGESVTVKQSPDDGETGLCQFRNGNTFEEWTLYRMFN